MQPLSGFELKALPIDDLKVSERAQRESSALKIQTMVNLFEKRGFGIPLVNQRANGEYYVLDGQHRIKAAQMLGFESVTCELATGLTEEQEADLFLLRNNNLEVYAVHKFNVAVTAGHEKETAINKVLKNLGMKVAFKANQEWVKVACVITLYRVFDTYGDEILSLALETAYATFGQHGIKSDFIEGLANVFANLDVDPDVVRTKLQTTSAKNAQFQLELAAAKIKTKYSLKSGLAMTQAIVDRLNTNKRGRRFQYWW